MATKTFISFSLSPFLYNLLVSSQDTCPVLMLFENQWFSTLCFISPFLPVQGLSCFTQQSLSPAPCPSKCEPCCSQQGLHHLWSSSPSSLVSSSLLHATQLKNHCAFLNSLIRTSTSSLHHMSLHTSGRHCHGEWSGCYQWTKLMISFPHSLLWGLFGGMERWSSVTWDEWGQKIF